MDRVSPAFRSHEAVRAILSRARTERLALSGIAGSCGALVAAAVAREAAVLLVVPDMRAADEMEADLRSLDPGIEPVILRPLLIDDPDDVEARAELSERLIQLESLRATGPGRAWIIPAAVLIENAPVSDRRSRRALAFETGGRLDAATVRRLAVEAGYSQVPMVAAPAEISIRGDVIDLYPMGERAPVRIELFDDEVESIRRFDVETQRSVEQLERVSVPLVRPQDLRPSRSGAPLASLLSGSDDPDRIVIRSAPARILDAIEEAAVAHDVDRAAVRAARTWLARAAGVDLVLARSDGPSALHIESRSVQGLGGGVDGLPSSIAALRQNADTIFLFVDGEGERNRMRNLLDERGLLERGLYLVEGRLRSGFQLLDLRIAWLNHLELLGKPRVYRPVVRRPRVPTRSVRNLLELTPGDYVVHLVHGVARYQGMTRIEREQGAEDHLVLEFDRGTTLYLSASKIDLVQRYVGTDGTPPRLDKIGGRSWARKKARVCAELEDLAAELLEVQAARATARKPPYPRDDALVEEFESSFPFPDTKDQREATLAIHADLDSPRPMDRLLCGDVGFGKTEIAIRAAFRAVLGGRQVAVLVPTTLLAEQHAETFASRFASFPVQVEVLSRFRSRGRQNRILEQLRDGAVDILIGTHRLLSRDVQFKDLGLIIVDEEQRFGVKAKESLKKLRASADVLSLSATPIPRTLHMALVGLRDISSLNTPPEGRRPVRTEIRRFEDAAVRRAIQFELDRGGQVFFVHNRVASLDRVATRVASLAPTARVATAHGQMSEGQLEAVIREFVRGDIDVLVSTNIVESGLDLPRVNTIFIDRPDLFGLADLHQLRGRVGRGHVQAYCYLLVPDRPLPSVAEKRIRAIEELSHLGAGYDLAIKDLEIRGAGNLLSSAQHGHIAAVGYDLFVRFLARAIARRKGTPPPREPRDIDVDLSVEAYLPAGYIEDPAQRMEMLRRLGSVDGPDPTRLEAEMRDRFGRLPPPARNLVRVFALKRRCEELGIRRLLYPAKGEVVIADLFNVRRFRRAHPFRQGEWAELSPRLVHLRLRRDQRDPDRVLAFLSARILGEAPR